MDLSSSLSQHRPAARVGACRLSLLAALPAVLAAGMLMSPPSAQAATDSAHTTKKAAKATGSKVVKHRATHARAGHVAAAAAVLAPIAVQAADSQQMAAFDRVNLGVSQCEFRQTVSVSKSAQHPGYVDLGFKGKQWLMKPVLSSTGALRLEDVRGETLFIQIRNKSMLMNQKSGQRLVDECVHPSQLQAMSSN